MITKNKRTESIRALIENHLSLEAAKKEVDRLYLHHKGDVTAYSNSPMFMVTDLVWDNGTHVPYINPRMLETSLIMLDSIVKGYDSGVERCILFFEYMYSNLSTIKSNEKPKCTLNGMLCVSSIVAKCSVDEVHKTVSDAVAKLIESILKTTVSVTTTTNTMRISFNVGDYSVDEVFDVYVNIALIDNGYLLAICGHIALQMLERMDMAEIESLTSKTVAEAAKYRLERLAVPYR